MNLETGIAKKSLVSDVINVMLKTEGEVKDQVEQSETQTVRTLSDNNKQYLINC